MEDRIIDRLCKIKSMITFIRSIISTQDGNELLLQGETLEGFVAILREIEQEADSLAPIYIQQNVVQQFENSSVGASANPSRLSK